MPSRMEPGTAATSPKRSSEARRPSLVVDPAYMKETIHTTMETRALGHRMSQAHLRQLSERMNSSCTMRFSQFALGLGSNQPSSADRRLRHKMREMQQRECDRHRPVPKEHPDDDEVTSASNADNIRRESVLRGEFDIMSRRHVARLEQDSAFKKERVGTMETVARSQRCSASGANHPMSPAATELSVRRKLPAYIRRRRNSFAAVNEYDRVAAAADDEAWRDA